MKEKPKKEKTVETPSKPARPNQAERDQHREALLDEALRESFPASDPPSSGRST